MFFKNNSRKLLIFFFSSRRRHTRSKRDWSSDVCSSDLRDTAIIAVLTATGIRLSELAGLRSGDVDLWQRELTVRGKGGKDRIVKIGHQAARSLDRYLRARSRHAHSWRPQLWLGAGNREPLTAAGIYQ